MRTSRPPTNLAELLKQHAGVLAIGVLLVGINRTASFMLPLSTKIVIDDIIGRQQLWMLKYLIGGVLAAGLVQGVTAGLITRIFSTGSYMLMARLRRNVHAHIMRLPIAFYDATKTGVLLSRIMNDVDGVRNLVGSGMLSLLGALITALVSVVVLFRISPLLTLLTLGILVGYLAASRRASRALRPIYTEGGRIMSEVPGRLSESLSGARVVKVYNAEKREDAIFAAGVGRILDNAFSTVRIELWINVTANAVTGLVGAVVIYVAVQQIAAGTMTLGGFGAFTAMMAMLVSPALQLAGTAPRLFEAAAAFDRVGEVLKQQPEDENPARTLAPAQIHGAIAFESIDFEYEPGRPVLHDISLRAAPGTVTALVGSSGAGKSTLIGLVAAFHTPKRGRVLVDGHDLATIRLDAYRSRLGVVFQESFLFDGTIAENVAYSRPDATREQILEACRTARVDEFAERYPEGYETIVGERGVKLSGGQKQRVSIARAILADPGILILDEATSSLDSESEAFIQDGLHYLMRNRTTFVIAHRLSTIRRADQILVLEAGRIVERGTHDSLRRPGTRYYDLYTTQYGDRDASPGYVDAQPVVQGSGTRGATR